MLSINLLVVKTLSSVLVLANAPDGTVLSRSHKQLVEIFMSLRMKKHR